MLYQQLSTAAVACPVASEERNHGLIVTGLCPLLNTEGAPAIDLQCGSQHPRAL